MDQRGRGSVRYRNFGRDAFANQNPVRTEADPVERRQQGRAESATLATMRLANTDRGALAPGD